MIETVGLAVLGLVIYLLSAIYMSVRAARRRQELDPFWFWFLWIYVIAPAGFTAVVLILIHVLIFA
jgi:hypothetical protein